MWVPISLCQFLFKEESAELDSASPSLESDNSAAFSKTPCRNPCKSYRRRKPVAHCLELLSFLFWSILGYFSFGTVAPEYAHREMRDVPEHSSRNGSMLVRKQGSYRYAPEKV